MIGQARIRELIPHAGSMCLIESVIAWDQDTIECRSSNHGRADHPLRHSDRLAAVHLIEYAAQAAAVHGALLAESEQRSITPGLLVATRNCTFQCAEIDAIPGDLTIVAHKRLATAEGLIYEFTVHSASGQELASGRISVMLRP